MNMKVEEISYSVRDKRLIESISLEIIEGEFIGLIGPNGSGKSTLLKNIYRVLKPDRGGVYLNGKDLSQMTQKETARSMAVVSQEANMAFDFAVMDIVMMGRAPHKRLLESDTARDQEIAERALARVGMQHAASSSFATLSGGEKQRVLIARALAQEAGFLILDEPTNHLDIRYQLQMMDLVKALKLTSFAALHDLNIAACYCDRIYVLNDGRIVAAGRPEEVMQKELLLRVFGVKTQISRHPSTGKPAITFLPEMLVN
ncbi:MULTISPECIES: ABC transporter ATP-binding protein [Paenibacillus]|uniref:ABC transporter n=1 Tax=Paenibacillus campinasensis TaxID=66347 RepID=A0A268F083_9BACL|nr:MULTISPECIES: ABC transporter ATP-binding protein [Paenibacillus]MUG65512.1 ATP-binding cassette domain-containing protein [Paenibacillus campinasensis]PAD78789.1 ABC transporter [Paenibacillus campinasensis]PAK53929.1 ABC transporter [Paenibacillus sp. 7541]